MFLSSHRHTRTLLLGSILLLFVIMQAVYLNAEYRAIDGFGFNLDDSWIHATIARNAATGQGWSFNPGEITGGSTAPLYTALLAVWYLVFGEVVWGAKLLGMTGLLLSALLLFFAIDRLTSERWAAWAAGAFCVSSPALLWSSLGGMEIGLALLSVAAAIYSYSRERYEHACAALSLGVWVRPEFGLLLGIAWFAVPNRKARLRAAVIVATILLPYFALNLLLNGTLFPATVSAKLEHDQTHFSFRFLQEAGWLLTTLQFWPVMLLIPAGAFALWKRAWWLVVAPVAFLLLLWSMSGTASNLGRWLHPLLIFVYVLAACATIPLTTRRPRWTLHARGVLVLIAAAQLWTGLGRAWIHGQSVRNISEMQVFVAEIVRQVTDPGEKVATNDVGALGYFGNRYVVDLVGLVTPRLTLEENLMQHHPVLVAIFDSWWPQRHESPAFTLDYRVWGNIALTPPNLVCGDSIMTLYARSDRFEAMTARASNMK